MAEIQRRIISVRSVQVMLDRDLAELYGVELKALNQAVKRNAERFPERFMYQLTKEEFKNLKSQFVTSSWGGVRKRPKVFTEQGGAMLSAVLHSSTAIDVSIRIMDAFVAMRRYLTTYGQVLQQIDQLRRQQILDQSKNDERFDAVFTALADGHLLPNGILPAGSEYDSLRYVSRLVESAKSEIVLIDNAELHNLGSSINSLGRRLTTYTTRDAKEIAKILSLLP